MSKRGEPDNATDSVEEGELEEGEAIEEDEQHQEQQDEQQNSWLFSSAEMATDRPSLREGMSPAQEDAARLKGVLLIQNLGVMLRM